MSRIFTFFYTDNCERQAIQPLADELAARGHKVRMTENLRERADVGIYCSHAVTPNAAFSVIALHDLAQRHDIWPAFWSHEPWHRFDLGIVPGQAWEDRWLTQRRKPEAQPRLGVFKAGWPKADLIFRDQNAFRQKVDELRASLNLKYDTTILYAPSWENDGKQDDFVQQLKDLPVNLLLKQAPWPDAYGWVLKNIEEMDALHRGMADNIHVIDRNVSIMYCIGLADLLVSDESSVLIEAALYEVPSVAVTDWTIPDHNPPRPACVPFENVRKISRTTLRATVEGLLRGEWNGAEAARTLRDFHFSELGHSAQLCADLILAGLVNAPLPMEPLGQALQARLEHDQAVYREAEALTAAGRSNESMLLLHELAEAGTECWQAYNDLGVFAYQQGDVPSALALLQEACTKADDEDTPFLNCATVLAQAGDPGAAIALYGKLLRGKPNDTQIINALGDLLIGDRGWPITVWHQLIHDIRRT